MFVSKLAVVAKETVSGKLPVFNGNLNPAFKPLTLEMEAAMFSGPLQGVSSPPGGSTEVPRPSVQSPSLLDLPSQMSSVPPISLAVDTPPLPTANLLNCNEVCGDRISGHIIHWAHQAQEAISWRPLKKKCSLAPLIHSRGNHTLINFIVRDQWTS